MFLAVVFAIGFKIYTLNYYKADDEAIAEIKQEIGDRVSTYSDKNLVVFVPNNEEAKAIIVFYPGGKVEYTAYSGLMYELADRGYACLLPRMPENLAFLRLNAVDIIKDKYPDRIKGAEGLKWYLAGHSLGGVAASQYLGEHADGSYAGIILCASFTTTDFSSSDLKLLSIYGSEDKVLNMDSYNESKSKWPDDAQEYVIKGGIHSYFGNYGIQNGDGIPSITNTEQIVDAADVITGFIGE